MAVGFKEISLDSTRYTCYYGMILLHSYRVQYLISILPYASNWIIIILGEWAYIKAEPNNDCKNGLKSIDQFLECEYLANYLDKTVELIKRSDFEAPYRPNGCYLFLDAYIYFNEHTTGRNMKSANKFCKLGKYG